MAVSTLPSQNLTAKSIKFLCSYGGRIIPRFTDGKLRYHGGDTRVLSVDSSISFSELLVKMSEMCGSSVSLRCQLPMEDLDALISITSDEDLANLIEEYERAAAATLSSFKIKAFLSAPKTTKKVSSPPSSASYFSSHASTPRTPLCLHSGGGGIPPRCPKSGGRHFKRLSSRSAAYPIICQEIAGKIPHQLVYQYQIGQANGCRVGRLVHNGNHWQ